MLNWIVWNRTACSFNSVYQQKKTVLKTNDCVDKGLSFCLTELLEIKRNHFTVSKKRKKKQELSFV